MSTYQERRKEKAIGLALGQARKLESMRVCSETFGITFHSHMTLEDIVEQWTQHAAPEIIAKFPELNITMQTARQILIAIRIQRQVKEVAQKVKDSLEETGAEQALLISGNPGMTAANLALQAAKLAAEELQKNLIKQTDKLLEKLSETCRNAHI